MQIAASAPVASRVTFGEVPGCSPDCRNHLVWEMTAVVSWGFALSRLLSSTPPVCPLQQLRAEGTASFPVSRGQILLDGRGRGDEMADPQDSSKWLDGLDKLLRRPLLVAISRDSCRHPSFPRVSLHLTFVTLARQHVVYVSVPVG